MKMNILLCILTFCTFVVGCTNKPKQEEAPQAPINNTVGINDTLGLSLHPEFPVYSTKQKQVTFVLHNNSDTHIGVGGSYSYTYEDEKGIWRDVPMQLVVFMEEIIVWNGNKMYINAELFRHIPGRYRFFYAVRRYNKEYTLMTEFQLLDNIPELFKAHPYSQLNDTLLPPEESVYPPIYNVIDEMPEFPGGMDKLLQFINDNMKYPTQAQTEGIQGKVAVQFIVDENGYIIEPNVVKSVEPSLDKEALRIIKMLPQWKPGTLKGKAVKVKYTVPVVFRLDKITFYRDTKEVVYTEFEPVEKIAL